MALLSSQVIVKARSSLCSASTSTLMSRTTIVPKNPIRFSVTASSFVPSSLNSTRFTAVLKSHTFTHLPVRTSHRRTVLSAAPEARRVVVGSISTVQRAPWWPW